MGACTTAILTRILPALLAGGVLYVSAPRSALGQSTPVAGYSPGARSATTANTMLDSVVGNTHSPIKNQTSLTGELYHIAADGTVTAPNGLLVSPGGCQTPGTAHLPTSMKTAVPHTPYRFGTLRHGKGFETVTIGVSTQPDLTTTDPKAPRARRATLNASFGPTGLYILPEPCARTGSSDSALTLDAAASLASADGNAFTLAGNRSSEIPVNKAETLPDGDVELRNSALPGAAAP
ncbi:hypothetical protein [Bombella apis]|uniref:Uncharacterized protein n=1 Tax=Bombella apis TaxID=1785988 RepID=A0ABR9MND0_9PROT|nr:hypothetical protein [Bombella apis]MBE1722805.1 hypothetical protein [Bombella apis]MBR9730610.1 hypothetical protein [Bombella apis]